jgi:DNA-binding NarL/FixJ family response regulator
MSNLYHRGLYLVALAVQPRLLREMLQRALDNTPGLMVADQQEELAKLQFLFRQVQIDWIVVATSAADGLPAEAGVMLDRYPSLSLLAIATDEDRVEVLIRAADGRICRYVLGDVELAELVTVLKYKPGSEAFPAVLVAAHRGPVTDDAQIPVWQNG